MDQGVILMLNGVSSAGKTTLARALQARMPQPWYLMGNDVFFDMLPEKFCKDDWPEAECQALEMMARTARLFSETGRSVILDTVYLSCMKRDCFSLLRDMLVDFPLYIVHVVCPEEEIARRERARGDRQLGQGAWQLSRLLPRTGYDLTVDTFAQTPEENAEVIVRFLDGKGHGAR